MGVAKRIRRNDKAQIEKLMEAGVTKADLEKFKEPKYIASYWVEKFIEDFKKVDIQKKLDMWYFALDQEVLWEEIITEMSDIAQAVQMKHGQIIKE